MLLQASFLLAALGSALAAPSDNALVVRDVTHSKSGPRTDRQLVFSTPPTAEPRTFLPAVHWSVNKWDRQHLAPQSTQSLYYTPDGTADPSKDHAFAQVDTGLIKDVVVLEHSNYVQSVTCQAGQIAVSFTNHASYRFAKKQWSSAPEFMLVTYSTGCGTRYKERSFWDVGDLAYNEHTLTITATVGEEVGSGQAMHSVGMSWGTWTAASRSAGLPSVSQASQADLDSGIKARPSHSRRSLERRLSLGGLFSDIGHAIVSGVNAIKETAVEGLKTVETAVETGVQAIKVVVNILTHPLEPNIVIPLNIAAEPNAPDAPWPNSVLIYSGSETTGSVQGEVNVYCVDCHLTGTLNLAGHVDWSLTEAVTQCYASVAGSVDAQAAIGISVQGQFQKEYSKTLFRKTIPEAGFQVGDLITVGAYIEISAKTQIEVEAAGQVLAGVQLSIPDFKASLDFKNSENSSTSGIDPKFTKIFDASGEISVHAGISLPVGIGVGVIIPPLKFDEHVELVEQPGINANIAYENTERCHGIYYNIQFEDTIAFDAFNNLVTVPIFHYTSPDLASGCFEIGSPGPSSTATTEIGPSATASPTATAFTPPDPTETGTGTTKKGRSEDNAPSQDDYEFEGYNFKYDDESSNDITTADYTYDQQLSDEALKEDAGDTGAYPSGTLFLIIQDISGQYAMVDDPSGNVVVGRPDDVPNYWAEYEGAVFGDTDGQFITYDADSVAEFNVSAIHMSPPDSIPPSSVLLFFVPAPVNGTDQYVYAAADERGQVFVLITCDFDGTGADGESRVYIARDQDEGIEALQSPALESSVTKGKVTSCASVGWAVPADAIGEFGS